MTEPSGEQNPRTEAHSDEQVEQWLGQVRAGAMSWSELAERLWRIDHPPVDGHHPDIDRARRCGFGEVIFGSGKSAETIRQIANRLLDGGQEEVLVTRVEPEVAAHLARELPAVRYDPEGRTCRLARRPILPVRRGPWGDRAVLEGRPAVGAAAGVRIDGTFPQREDSPLGDLPPVAVVTGGSTDLSVAREAVETLGWMGIAATMIFDVGVAGPYRLLPYLDCLRRCAAVVVVAGMEGALVSVVGGLVPCPVIAVPTSVGYGANLQGVTTLLSMLSSCAAGVSVVNIDAGFKGGYVAGLVAHQAARLARGIEPGADRSGRQIGR